MEKMMMPAYYNVLSTEEMTYTEGGATMVQAACAWFIPFYGWFKGITAVRDYRKKNRRHGGDRSGRPEQGHGEEHCQPAV